MSMIKFLVYLLTFISFLNPKYTIGQIFKRTELPTVLDIPWEICYGKDGYLWISESSGRVARVNPNSGAKKTVYTAPDYFNGSLKEQSKLCFKPKIGAGTLGLALHPDFPDSPYVFLVHSYNQGSVDTPKTQFKIIKLTWNQITDTFTDKKDIVLNLPVGYDHLGGRLISIKQNGTYYLYFSAGDNGISEDSEPDCYLPQTTNPNNFTQNINYKNGKIHRFYLDGSIPTDNPVKDNSFYTRGHRNPQGLAYNAEKGIVYEIEHGDRTDDEINILESGRNYGWKNVRGFKSDNNYPGEKAFVDTFKNNKWIPNDSLMDPIFVWCKSPLPASNNYLDWCTVAPSDAYYYNLQGIPAWQNSLLVVTLKNGIYSDQQLYDIKLTEDGKKISTDAADIPNPTLWFGEDQKANGRLRDLTFNPKGNVLYLINNGGNTRDKITVYTYTNEGIMVYPNPAKDYLKIDCKSQVKKLEIWNYTGEKLLTKTGPSAQVDISMLKAGLYIIKVQTIYKAYYQTKFIKQ